VSGYMRWRLINAIPIKNDHDRHQMANIWVMINENYEADEVFTGTFDSDFGTLNTETHELRAVPGGNPDHVCFIAACCNSFVLIHDGTEMVARAILMEDGGVKSRAAFFELGVTRCVAY